MDNLESLFPELIGSIYLVTSPEDIRYNCVGWAMEDTQRWWWNERDRQAGLVTHERVMHADDPGLSLATPPHPPAPSVSSTPPLHGPSRSSRMTTSGFGMRRDEDLGIGVDGSGGRQGQRSHPSRSSWNCRSISSHVGALRGPGGNESKNSTTERCGWAAEARGITKTSTSCPSLNSGAVISILFPD